MNLSLVIAGRYLISKRINAVSIIGWISALGMLVGSFGLVIVLSVFNGFEGLVISLYNSFNPDFTISAKAGKSFLPDENLFNQLHSLEGIKAVSEVIEENALLTYNDNQHIATIKGVSDNYGSLNSIDSSMYEGVFILKEGSQEFAVLGAGIAQSLGINYADPLGFISVYMPKKGKFSSNSPEEAFNRDLIRPAGSFAIQAEFDGKYVFVPLEFARKITGYEHELSSLEVAAKQGANLESLQNEIRKIFGPDFVIKNRLQQNETLYKVMRTEKWAVYAILTLILIVAAFNIIGSLSMLVIEKKDDIAILKTMGADSSLIRKIFLFEGMLLSIIGCAIGFTVAISIIYAQHTTGFLKMGGGSFVIDSYPVELKVADLILVFFTVMIIGMIASWLPAVRATKSQFSLQKQ